MITFAALILFAMKLVADAAYGWRALKKADELTKTVAAGFANHEKRITSLEEREVTWRTH